MLFDQGKAYNARELDNHDTYERPNAEIALVNLVNENIDITVADLCHCSRNEVERFKVSIDLVLEDKIRLFVHPLIFESADPDPSAREDVKHDQKGKHGIQEVCGVFDGQLRAHVVLFEHILDELPLLRYFDKHEDLE